MRFMTRASLALFLLSLFALSATPNPVQAFVAFDSYCSADSPPGLRFEQFNNFIFGTLPSGSLTGEIVVSTQVLTNGQTITLPIYPSDGVAAHEDEIFWTISMKRHFDPDPDVGIGLIVDFTGRTLSFFNSDTNNILEFHVTVVAVRKAAPVAVEETSIGEVKTKFEE